MAKRERFDITLTMTTPPGMRPEAVKLEVQSRLNELCGYGSFYGAGRARVELPDTAAAGGVRAINIKVRRPARV